MEDRMEMIRVRKDLWLNLLIPIVSGEGKIAHLDQTPQIFVGEECDEARDVANKLYPTAQVYEVVKVENWTL